jgi:hypothetical protein
MERTPKKSSSALIRFFELDRAVQFALARPAGHFGKWFQ